MGVSENLLLFSSHPGEIYERMGYFNVKDCLLNTGFLDMCYSQENKI